MTRPWKISVLAPRAAILGLAMLFAQSAAAADRPGASLAPVADLAAACKDREGWTDPAPPARIFGDTWFVGTCGITVLLITSDAGHVLIDGGPAKAAALVAANIENLGIRLSDVRWIVSSHEHEDHVGAIAELKRLTGARFAALASAIPALAAGRPGDDDPQRATAKDFAPITVDRSLRDGEQLRVGSLRITAHATPVHSPGSASWTWQSCLKNRCRTVTYADSATVISAGGYRFKDRPERIAAARAGLSRITALPCGILITPHPSASNLFERVAGREPLDDSRSCRRYAAQAKARMAARLTSEDE